MFFTKEEKIQEIQKILIDLDNKILMEDYLGNLPFCLIYKKCGINIREEFIKKQGYVVLTQKLINGITEFVGDKKILEVMSGNGALAYYLREKGVNIKATDDKSWEDKFETELIEVEKIDCIEAIEKYGREVDFILMSWAYMDNMAYRCLLKMREVNPKLRLIYFGEGWGGCTADDDFYSNMIEIEDERFEYLVESNSRRFDGIHDYPYLIR